MISTPLAVVALFYNHRHGDYQKLANAEGSEEEQDIDYQPDKGKVSVFLFLFFVFEMNYSDKNVSKIQFLFASLVVCF
jgi:hypothetical protein